MVESVRCSTVVRGLFSFQICMIYKLTTPTSEEYVFAALSETFELSEFSLFSLNCDEVLIGIRCIMHVESF